MKFKVFDTKKKKFVDSSTYYLSPDGKLIQLLSHAPFIFSLDYLIPIYSTGLKDKNGVEYEDGSVFELKGVLSVVFWCKIRASFCIGTERFSFDHQSGLDGFGLHIEKIIGSKYTNPELMETECQK